MKRLVSSSVLMLSLLVFPLTAQQYKRVHQEGLRAILQGEPEKAIESMETFLEENPEDEESYFILTLAYAESGETEQAIEAMEQALGLGLPAGRFVAGPRGLSAGIEDHPAYAELRESIDRPLHGPMIGAVTPRRARFWVRTAEPSEVRVLVSRSADLQDARASQAIRTREAADFTAVIEVGELEPGQEYRYGVQIDGKEPVTSSEHRFRTAPSEPRGSFSIAFGGGAGYVPENERVWDTIRERRPRALLLLGDNIYSDDPESTAMQRYCYYRRQSRPEFRRLLRHTPVYSIWDDHDFATNDSWGGPEVGRPDWKPAVWRTYRRNWVNPGYGDGKPQPGCYYTFSIGAVDFFMLDCRYYREDPGHDRPSMLGPVQKAWLKDRLERSDATFKVLVSSVPWDFRTKGDSPDTWNGYRRERHEIFRFLADREIEGVLLMSADRHRSDAWRIEREEGYDLLEFNSSRLTNQHVHAEKEEAIFSYNDTQSFGLVSFDLDRADPNVTYQVVDIDGRTVEELTLKRSRLTH